MNERHPKKGKWIDTQKKFVIHQDILEGLMHYEPDNNSLKDVFEGRDKMTQEGQEYWNTDHDEEMRQTAEELSKDPEFIEYCLKYGIVF